MLQLLELKDTFWKQVVFKELPTFEMDADPIRLWEFYLLKYQLITVPFKDVCGPKKTGGWKDRIRTICIIIFLLAQVIRCIKLLLLENALDTMTRLSWGTIYYHMGVTGKVLYVVSISGGIQMLLMRLLLSYQERYKQLSFLSDINVYRRDIKGRKSGKTNLQGKFRDMFLQQSLKKLKSSLKSRIVIMILATSITFSGTCHYVLKEKAKNGMSTGQMFIWFCWFVSQNATQYFGILTATIVHGFWFISRLHLNILMQQAMALLNGMLIDLRSPQRQSWKSTGNQIKRKFNTFVAMVHDIEMKVHNFNQFSRYYLTIVTMTSSLISSALMIVTILSESPLIKFLNLCGWIFMTLPPISLLRSATNLHHQSKRMTAKCHECSVEMSFRNFKGNSVKITSAFRLQRIILNHLIEDLGDNSHPSITLKNAADLPYDISHFALFIINGVGTFIIMLDFVDDFVS